MKAARDVFERRGYEDATISEIADSIGVVEGTVLHYFQNKRTLMARVIESCYEENLDSLEKGIYAIDGARNKLRYAIHLHMAYLFDNENLCSVILCESRGSHLELLEKVHDFNRRYTNCVMKIVKEGKASGEIAANIPATLVRNVVFGTTEHYLWDALSGNRTRESSLEIADMLIALIFDGVAKRPEQNLDQIQGLIGKLNRLLPED
ncbi:TetR family transcriptional regulator [Spongiibacter taiwanensis]|uniref:TetR/AcrR family transcriptional regulator n=1 Tax=Spongiibacter taiwanensis TaxID=1748242 RepID=UPI00203625BF|nr:TetR/AcrR family transcriptional regulator [Spongiibacter taiwanensis]USA44774.1 TetR family transcriptional regulator [Spongiibacter taiwanensis]